MSGVKCESIKPSNLSDIDLERIYTIEQDMWGREQGLGAYVYCKSCDQTFSKQAVYGEKVPQEVYRLLVSEIESQTKGEFLCCPKCAKSVTHSFEKNAYIQEIQEKYSDQALLTLMLDSERNIVGFADGYMGSLDTIFKRELSYRYPEGMRDKIEGAIESKNDGYCPEKLFTGSAIGTTERYMGMRSIYKLLQTFFIDFPRELDEELCIGELNGKGPLAKIYQFAGAEVLDIQDPGVKNATDTYNSGLFIQKKVGEKYRQVFSLELKQILSQI